LFAAIASLHSPYWMHAAGTIKPPPGSWTTSSACPPEAVESPALPLLLQPAIANATTERAKTAVRCERRA
jgi:hypothetical protein